MRVLLTALALASLTACGPESLTTQMTDNESSITTAGQRLFYVQEITTESGTKCVIATGHSGGPAISCKWN